MLNVTSKLTCAQYYFFIAAVVAPIKENIIIWPIPIAICVVMLLFISYLFVKNFHREQLATKLYLSTKSSERKLNDETSSPSNKKQPKNTTEEPSRELIGCLKFPSSRSKNKTKASGNTFFENDPNLVGNSSKSVAYFKTIADEPGLYNEGDYDHAEYKLTTAC